MSRTIGILVALALVGAGVGVVRPQTTRLVRESWELVARESVEVGLTENAAIELNETGEYIVFLEGPASDSFWSQAQSAQLQLLDSRNRVPLVAARQGPDFSYELDGRRAEALSKVTVAEPGTYLVAFGNANSRELRERGFKVKVNRSTLVTDQSRKALGWLIAGVVVGCVMGIVALMMLTSREA